MIYFPEQNKAVVDAIRFSNVRIANYDNKIKDMTSKRDHDEKVIEDKDKIEVVDKTIEVNPKVDIECPKCSNMKAYFWTLQTRAADEAETRFYKCTKCSHRWRANE